jgi:hypothetical protein
MSALAFISAPNPQPAPLTYDPDVAAQRRKLDCVYTRGCLGVAVREEWFAMSCESCHAYLPVDPEQARADDMALIDLLGTAVSGRRRRAPPCRSAGGSNGVTDGET